MTHALKTKQQEAVHTALLQLQQMQMQRTQQEQQRTAGELQERQLQQAITTTQQEIATLGKEIANFPADRPATVEKQFEKRRTHYQQWGAQLNVLKNELDQMQQKKSSRTRRTILPPVRSVSKIFRLHAKNF